MEKDSNSAIEDNSIKSDDNRSHDNNHRSHDIAEDDNKRGNHHRLTGDQRGRRRSSDHRMKQVVVNPTEVPKGNRYFTVNA